MIIINVINCIINKTKTANINKINIKRLNLRVKKSTKMNIFFSKWEKVFNFYIDIFMY